MNVKQKMKLFLKSMFIQLGSVVTESGMTILFEEEELAVGINVYREVETEDGNFETMPLETGTYKVSNGKNIIVENGVVIEISETPTEEPIEEPMAEEPEHIDESMAEEPVEAIVEQVEEVKEDVYDAKAEIEALRSELEVLKETVEKMLEVPSEENAFEKQENMSRQDTKPVFKTRK